MEALIHLDTHVVVWLYAGDLKRLKPVRTILEEHTLVISPIVRLELVFLVEIGRLTRRADEIVADLVDRVGLQVATSAFDQVMSAAEAQTWTRDPFDRLIVGGALTANLPLLTADRIIRRHVPTAVWGPSP